MIRTPETQDFSIKAYLEQQELRGIAACFSRDAILGYITDSLGYINSAEIEQLAQSLYTDAVADKPRPLSTVLKETGLTRESEQLRYLRSFLGRLDQAFVTTLRSTHGHDILMSHVALEYNKAEMEEKIDLTPWEPGKPFRNAYWRAGEGPTRPLMIDLFHLESQGFVNIQSNGNQEVILPTQSMDDTANSLEAIIQSPIISKRNILLIAGEFETRALIRS